MVFQAFIDDSRDPAGTFVLAGHIASAEAWVAFSKDWEEMLPYGTRSKSGDFHFKMAEMAFNPERMARVPNFYRIIEHHVLMSVSCTLNTNDLERAKARVYVPDLKIDWGYFDNPYMVAFRCLMDMFHTKKDTLEKIIPVSEPVDFIFDMQTERKPILAAWEDYIRERPEHLRERYGSAPRFEDDRKFLPLQAADLWAWWVRHWHKEGRSDKLESLDFGAWQAKRDHPRAAISFNEDQIVEAIRDIMRPMLEPGRLIYDVTFSPLRSS